ncbi:MAG: hypothetical protein ACE5GW_06305, partial [Planctomycetota bacterium]
AQGSSTGMIPLIDLGSGTYQGFDGGLYGGGENAPPADHLQAALDHAVQIVPRNAAGEPDPAGGVIVMLSIGMSNTTHEFSVFERQEDLNTGRNARVVILNTALGGQAAEDIAPPGAPYWNIVLERLAAMHLTPAQVQVAWLKEAMRQPPDDFPGHAGELRDHLISIAQNLRGLFENMHLCYLSSRIYAGYAQTTLNPEPQAYESGFSVRWTIEEQMNGDPLLNHDPQAGPVEAPLLLWGPYLWADGVIPRSDGLTWLEEDFQSDGTHPSASGEQKVGDLLSAFFATDATAQVWYAPDPGVSLVALDATDDASVSAAEPAANFGAAGELIAEGGPLPLHTYLRFDAPALTEPRLWSKLGLRVLSSGGGPLALVPESGWSEESITYGNAPPFETPALVNIPRASRDGTIAAGVSGILEEDTDGVLSFALPGAPGPVRRYASKEGGQPPRLVVALLTGSPPEDDFLRGDGNEDGAADLADAVFALAHLFQAAPAPCLDALDANDDGVLDIGDPIALLGFLFAAGAPPPPPFPDPGPDPTPDPLGCGG